MSAVSTATARNEFRQPKAAADAASGAVAPSVPRFAKPIWRLVSRAKRSGGKRWA
jgi:hypothetical protein